LSTWATATPTVTGDEILIKGASFYANGNKKDTLTVQDSARRLELGRDQIQAKDLSGTVQNLYIQPAGNTVFASSSGNVGIGVVSPADLLHIADTVSSNALVTMRAQNSLGYAEFGTQSNYARLLSNGTLLYAGTSSQHFHYIGGSTAMTLNGTGLGIGTSPQRKLHVSTGNTDIAARFENTTSNGSVAEFISSGDGRTLTIQTDHIYSNGNLFFGLGNYTNTYRAGTHIFQEDTGNTEVMRITGNNVGISTTSPNHLLEIEGQTNDTEVVQISNNAGGSGSVTGITHLGITHFPGNTYSSTRITAIENGTASYTGHLAFSTRSTNSDSAPAERMRITSTGNLGIGVASPAEKLHVQRSGTGSGLGDIISETTTHNGNAGYRFRTNGTDRWAITTIGTNGSDLRIRDADGSADRIQIDSSGDLHCDQDVIAFSTTPSDKRLKKNIKDIDYGLDTIMKLNPKEYDWKKDNRHDIGFIAQEVEEVIPEIVKDKKHFDKEIKTLDYEKLTAVLIRAVQEQQEQINKLEEKLNG
jgi:hypothetical protein